MTWTSAQSRSCRRRSGFLWSLMGMASLLGLLQLYTSSKMSVWEPAEMSFHRMTMDYQQSRQSSSLIVNTSTTPSRETQSKDVPATPQLLPLLPLLAANHTTAVVVHDSNSKTTTVRSVIQSLIRHDLHYSSLLPSKPLTTPFPSWPGL